jgi:hypothetical protein
MEVSCRLLVMTAFTPNKIFQDVHWMRGWEKNRISLGVVKNILTLSLCSLVRSPK